MWERAFPKVWVQSQKRRRDAGQIKHKVSITKYFVDVTHHTNTDIVPSLGVVLLWVQLSSFSV